MSFLGWVPQVCIRLRGGLGQCMLRRGSMRGRTRPHIMRRTPMYSSSRSQPVLCLHPLKCPHIIWRISRKHKPVHMTSYSYSSSAPTNTPNPSLGSSRGCLFCSCRATPEAPSRSARWRPSSCRCAGKSQGSITTSLQVREYEIAYMPRTPPEWGLERLNHHALGVRYGFWCNKSID